jgi:hypothetical protein
MAPGMPEDPSFPGAADAEDGFAPTTPLPLAGGFSLGGLGAPPPVFVPQTSTPLHEDDPESPIPPPALWAMKYRRHLRLTLSSRDQERLRERLGEGDGAVYLIDDGGRHAMVSRLVGNDEDGSTYCLVGRITGTTYDRYAIGEADTNGIFAEARDLALCSVFAAPEAVSNVVVAETYGSVADVPPEYLPPQPFLEFAEDPAPEDPAPEDPAPEDPAPEDPAPEDPPPEDPAPEDPAPEDPPPEDPAPG